MSHSLRKKLWYLLFTGPTCVIFATVVLVPFVIGLVYTFADWNGIPLNPVTWIGFANYAALPRDTQFFSSMGHTFLYTVIAIITINLFGLAFALITTSGVRGANVARTMFFMPYLIGGIILGYIWKFVFMNVLPSFSSIADPTTGFFSNWLNNPVPALFAMVVVSTWQMAGYIMIIYIAGLTNIPVDVMEAANVDGANFWQRLRHITLPLLAPSFTICLFLTLSNSFKIYDVNLSLTKGGLYNTTQMLAMNIYNEIFQSHHYGYGQTKALVFFVVVAAITLTQVYLSKRNEVEMQ